MKSLRSWSAATLAAMLFPLGAPAAAQPADAAMTVKLSVLSSSPQWVSGGDARIHVRAAPGQRDKLEFRLNGRPHAVAMKEVADGLEGVITGLAVGANQLEVKHRNGNVRDALTLTNHPITGPMFTGPQQQPFVCTTNQGGISRQPKVDSTTPLGYRVTDGPTVATGNTIGYSRDCSIDTFVTYLYRRASGGNLVALPTDGSRPADMGQVTLADGRTVLVATDGTWKHQFGPLLENDLLMGEAYDARPELPGPTHGVFGLRLLRPREGRPVVANNASEKCK